MAIGTTTFRRALGGIVIFGLLAAADADARPGDLDPSFGLGGFVTTDFGAADGASDVAIQPDGRIVAAGTLSGEFKLARYNANGSLDPSFDGDGTVVTGFGADDSATSVALQPDGKIVAAGFTEAGPSPRNFALVRYNADGSLDSGFDGDGVLFTDLGGEDTAADVAIAPGGQIVVTGLTVTGAGAADFAFARYLANGAPDNSFDGDGQRLLDLGALDYAIDAEVLADGRIVAVGMSGTAAAGFDIGVGRLTAAGAPDPSFSGDGRLRTTIGDFASAGAVATQPDGRILVTGEAGPEGGDSALVRYQPDGALDPSFGAGGVARADYGRLEDAALQADGKIVTTAGDAFGLARFNPDGSADPSFGTAGLARIEFGSFSFANALALQADGRIVAAGVTDAGPNPENFGLVRVAGGEPVPPVGPPSSTCAGRAATILAVPGTRTKGTPGVDVIVGTAKRDRIKAGAGRDVVCTLTGKARVRAGPGRDLVIGGNGKDVLIGEGGRDKLRGKGGNDRLLGGPGADRLVGGKGRRDHCAGGPGRDRSRGC